jgi:hypothetical protein
MKRILVTVLIVAALLIATLLHFKNNKGIPRLRTIKLADIPGIISARDTAILANERYQKGLSNYLDVVDAQRVALQAERQQTQLPHLNHPPRQSPWRRMEHSQSNESVSSN